jgi:hypothetical protein
MSATHHVDLEALRSGPAGRMRLLREFVGFTEDDHDALRESAVLLGPRLPALLDALYDHLLSFDDTRQIFLDAGGILDPAYMARRKEHLTEWIMRTITECDRPDFAIYVDSIGRMHTASAGDPDKVAPNRYVVGHMAFLQVALWSALFDALPTEPERVRRLGLAWTKILMIQLEMMLAAAVMGWDADLRVE